MKIILPLFIFMLLPFACNGIVAEVIFSKLFYSTVITEGVSSLFEIGKTFVTEAFKVKETIKETANVTYEKRTEISVSTDLFGSQSELSQIADTVKRTNDKMKASFKSVKSLLRNYHFQTHVQFPTEKLVLHLEQFLSKPSNATEADLRLTCTDILPNSVIKTIETMLKDNWLVQQSDNDPGVYAKLERGIIIMVKQLIFAQSVCLQIRNFGNEMAHQNYSLMMAKSIEFSIKKQKMDVEIQYQITTILGNALNKESSFDFSDIGNENASLYENVGTHLCQQLKESNKNAKLDFFLTRKFNDFTIISKNRYFKKSFNDWIVYVFYPKISLKESNRLEAKVIEGSDDSRSKNVIKNQIIFECKSKSHCSLSAGDDSGMYSNDGEKFIHYAICGNVGVTIGRATMEVRKVDEMTEDEKMEQQKWEKTKAELSEFLQARRVKNLESEMKHEEARNKLAEVITATKANEEVLVNEKIQPAALISNSGNVSAYPKLHFFGLIFFVISFFAYL